MKVMSRASKTLKIAVFSDDFFPASGGISRSIQTQISGLAERGHQVTLFVPKFFLDKPDNCRVVVVPTLYFRGAPPYTTILRYDYWYAKKISKQHSFDIVHSQTERGGLMLAANISKIQKIPHIHTFHANLAGTHETDPFASLWGSLAYLALVNPSIALISKKRIASDVVIPPGHTDALSFPARFDWHTLATIASRVDAYSAPAHFMIRRIEECSEGLVGRGEVIPTGVNPVFSEAIKNTKRTVKGNTLRLLSVCRLSREKRVDIIIESFILANLPNGQLDIVGTGDQLKRLRKQAKDHPNIIFHEQISDMTAMAKLYKNADAFILASYKFDTQAITIAEGVVAGLPIVYCDDRLDIGVDPSNSLLAEGPHAEDIAAAIRKLSDKKLRRTLSRASSKIAPNLAPERMTKQYIELYRRAINN